MIRFGVFALAVIMIAHLLTLVQSSIAVDSFVPLYSIYAVVLLLLAGIYIL